MLSCVFVLVGEFCWDWIGLVIEEGVYVCVVGGVGCL